MNKPIDLEKLQKIRLDRAVEPSIVDSFLIRIPASWELIIKNEDGAMFKRGNIQVIASIAFEEDNNIWIHISCCKSNKSGLSLPEWDDFKRVKNDFIGEHKYAYQIFPPKEHYININPSVLHLFSPLQIDGPLLPDFTSGTNSL